MSANLCFNKDTKNVTPYHLKSVIKFTVQCILHGNVSVMI